MKSIKKILVVMAIATLILTITVATASATTDVKDEKKNNGIAIESKEKKVSSYKITWNYNGGKIGTKKTKVTTVKKGSKIGKLPTTPKKSSYTFKGWYTKKSGGKKISVNTKPTKSVTLYAKWTKGSTNTNSKLVGVWQFRLPRPTGSQYGYDYIFYKDGTFKYFLREGSYVANTEGKYKAANGKIYLTNSVYQPGTEFELHYKDATYEYKFGKDTTGEYLLMPPFRHGNITYVDIKSGVKFRK